MWESNANYVAKVYGSFVDWEERFYICPECGEKIDISENYKACAPVINKETIITK